MNNKVIMFCVRCLSHSWLLTIINDLIVWGIRPARSVLLSTLKVSANVSGCDELIETHSKWTLMSHLYTIIYIFSSTPIQRNTIEKKTRLGKPRLPRKPTAQHFFMQVLKVQDLIFLSPCLGLIYKICSIQHWSIGALLNFYSHK